MHLEGKSNYARLDSMDESEIYLKCISREMSQVGSDFLKCTQMKRIETLRQSLIFYQNGLRKSWIR